MWHPISVHMEGVVRNHYQRNKNRNKDKFSVGVSVALIW